MGDFKVIAEVGGSGVGSSGLPLLPTSVTASETFSGRFLNGLLLETPIVVAVTLPASSRAQWVSIWATSYDLTGWDFVGKYPVGDAYDPAATYNKGDVVAYGTDKSLYYVSLQDTNTGHQPDTATTYWSPQVITFPRIVQPPAGTTWKVKVATGSVRGENRISDAVVSAAFTIAATAAPLANGVTNASVLAVTGVKYHDVTLERTPDGTPWWGLPDGVQFTLPSNDPSYYYVAITNRSVDSSGNPAPPEQNGLESAHIAEYADTPGQTVVLKDINLWPFQPIGSTFTKIRFEIWTYNRALVRTLQTCWPGGANHFDVDIGPSPDVVSVAAPNATAATAAVSYALQSDDTAFKVSGAVSVNTGDPAAVALKIMHAQLVDQTTGEIIDVQDLYPLSTGLFGSSTAYESDPIIQSTTTDRSFKLRVTSENGTGQTTSPPFETSAFTVLHAAVSSVTAADIGSRTVDPTTRLVSTTVGFTPTMANNQVPQVVASYLSRDGGSTYVWVGWQTIFFVGQTLSFKALAPTVATNWKVACGPGPIPGDPSIFVAAANLPAGVVQQVTAFSAGALALPSSAGVTSASIAAGAGGANPYNTVDPDSGRQYATIPGVTYTDPTNDVNSWRVLITVQDIASDGSTTLSSEKLFHNVQVGGGTHTSSALLATYDHVYQRYKIYSCNRVDQTESAFTNGLCATLQTCWPGSANHFDVNIGPLPSGVINPARLDPSRLDASLHITGNKLGVQTNKRIGIDAGGISVISTAAPNVASATSPTVNLITIGALPYYTLSGQFTLPADITHLSQIHIFSPRLNDDMKPPEPATSNGATISYTTSPQPQDSIAHNSEVITFRVENEDGQISTATPTQALVNLPGATPPFGATAGPASNFSAISATANVVYNPYGTDFQVGFSGTFTTASVDPNIANTKFVRVTKISPSGVETFISDVYATFAVSTTYNWASSPLDLLSVSAGTWQIRFLPVNADNLPGTPKTLTSVPVTGASMAISVSEGARVADVNRLLTTTVNVTPTIFNNPAGSSGVQNYTVWFVYDRGDGLGVQTFYQGIYPATGTGGSPLNIKGVVVTISAVAITFTVRAYPGAIVEGSAIPSAAVTGTFVMNPPSTPATSWVTGAGIDTLLYYAIPGGNGWKPSIISANAQFNEQPTLKTTTWTVEEGNWNGSSWVQNPSVLGDQNTGLGFGSHERAFTGVDTGTPLLLSGDAVKISWLYPWTLPSAANPYRSFLLRCWAQSTGGTWVRQSCWTGFAPAGVQFSSDPATGQASAACYITPDITKATSIITWDASMFGPGIYLDPLTGKPMAGGTDNPSNMLLNGAFEDTPLGSTVAPPGWTIGSGQVGTLSAVSFPVFAGTKSIAMTGTHSSIVQTFNCRFGDAFYAEAWVSSNSSNGSFRLVMIWLDANGNFISLVEVTPQLSPPGGAWTLMQLSGQAPSGCAKVQLFVGTNGSTTGTWYVDNVLLRPKITGDQVQLSSEFHVVSGSLTMNNVDMTKASALAAQFQVVGGIQTITNLDAGLLRSGKLQIGGGTAKTALAKFYDTQATPVMMGFIGDDTFNGTYNPDGSGYVGAWFKRCGFGGTGPLSPVISCDSNGNVIIGAPGASGSLTINGTVAIANFANSASSAANASNALNANALSVVTGTVTFSVNSTNQLQIVNTASHLTTQITDSQMQISSNANSARMSLNVNGLTFINQAGNSTVVITATGISINGRNL